ncbi:hypothetical protein MGH68_15460 [Erysipelothrix sp. D19-032]
MWRGDAKYWGRVSPVLFPIVGRVKDGFYVYDGQKYELSAKMDSYVINSLRFLAMTHPQ